jgi:tetratricopeptide (TPR) repeat protein
VVLATRAIGLAAALTLGWVVVPLNADRGARHFEVLQEPRGTFAAFARAHGNEALGVYYRSRDAGREHAAWVRATEADPLNPRYHINRANAALKLHAIAEAQHHFERALDRGLDEWHVYYNLGVCAMQLGEPARAETWYTQLIDKYPEEWRGWGGRGEARLALKRPAEALGDLQQLVQMQPDGAYGFQLLGRAYQDTGQPTEARAAWQRALQLDPADQRTRQLLGLP